MHRAPSIYADDADHPETAATAASAAPELPPQPITKPHKRRFLVWIAVVLVFIALFWWVRTRGHEESGSDRRWAR